MRDPRLEKLADVLVRYSVEAKPGQLVQIIGPTASEPLAMEVYRKVIAAGAHPSIRLRPADAERVMLESGSKAQLEYVSPLQQHEVETMDACVTLWAEENTRSLSAIDPEKSRVHGAARKQWLGRFLQRAAEGKLKWVGTLLPTQSSAQDARMSLHDYETFVYSAGYLDEADPVAKWKALSVNQQKLADFLGGKKELRVTSPNGTDLSMSIAGRKWINCDGHENFPDGEVFSGPIVESVKGTIVYNLPGVYRSTEVRDVRLVFKDGKVTDFSASMGKEYLGKMLATDAGSAMLGECAIGTNRRVQRHTCNTLFDEKIGGSVHFALGAGYPETGNTNSSGLHWDMVLDLRPGGQLLVDGQVLMKDGLFSGEFASLNP